MVVVFDLNGTLLDNRAVQPVLRSIFGRKLGAQEFFTRVLQYSMALTLSGEYRALSEIGRAVLEMEAEARQITLTTADKKRVQTALKKLPPFQDVPKSLRRLRKANLRLAVLTNSALEDAREQVANARIDSYFEQVLSVSEVRRFKPSRETYQFAADALGVHPREILMVAAHAWDLMGAAAAGCQTAFVGRPGEALFPGASRPAYVVKDLAQLVKELLPAEARRVPRLLGTIAGVGAISALGVAATLKRSRLGS